MNQSELKQDGQLAAAVVVGGGSAIGAALSETFRQNADRDLVVTAREPVALAGAHCLALNFDEPLDDAQFIRLWPAGPIERLVICIGMLHAPGQGPEKTLAAVREAELLEVMRVNAWLPLRALKLLTPLLARRSSVRVAVLSALVGSIGDNELGGWYSYRMSKAALNMGLRTAALELARFRPDAALVAVHPGTTASPLTAPYLDRHAARPPAVTAGRIIGLLDRLTPADNGRFFHADGHSLPW